MEKDYLFYLNRNKLKCVTIPSRKCDNLNIKNYLSEFKTDEEKKLVLDNLGITELITYLKNLLDNKIIEKGGLAFDAEPTEGHIDHVISSDAFVGIIDNLVSKNELGEYILNYINDILTDSNIETKILELKTNYNSLRDRVETIEANLNSAIEAGKLVTPVLNEFGDNEKVGISQKVLTDRFDNIENLISRITGEPPFDVEIKISPTEIITKNPSTTITITATELEEKYEFIKIYKDEDLIETHTEVSSLNNSIEISEDCEIKVLVKILGKIYSKRENIRVLYPFYVGSGDNYESIMTSANIVKVTTPHTIIDSLEIRLNGDKIFIVVPSDDNRISKIDLNGFTIPFNLLEIDGYKIYTSLNGYTKGTINGINIHINE